MQTAPQMKISASSSSTDQGTTIPVKTASALPPTTVNVVVKMPV